MQVIENEINMNVSSSDGDEGTYEKSFLATLRVEKDGKVVLASDECFIASHCCEILVLEKAFIER